MNLRLILLAIIAISCIFIVSSVPKAAYATTINITFTDPLYEDWKEKGQLGSSALFDTNTKKAEISDVCGELDKYQPGRAYDGHQGWDRNIPNDNGTYTVFAIAPGVIEHTRSNCSKGDTKCGGGAGNYVIMRHTSSIVSKIFHLRENKVFVSVGQWVDRLHPLGLGGSTGNSSGEHVHIQVEVDGVPVDPTSFPKMWSPNLVIDTDSCEDDPQHGVIGYSSLVDYTKSKLDEFVPTLEDAGLTLSKDQYWFLDSHGSNLKDVIMRDYEADGYTSALVYDLIGHAPSAIFMHHKVLTWWVENGSIQNFGKPIASYATAKPNEIEYNFEHGYLRFAMSTATAAGKITTSGKYPEDAAPGMYSKGWMSGKSYAFVQAYKKYGGSSKFGYPTGVDAKTSYVHNWDGYELQDFQGGSLGSCGIMLAPSSDNFKAFVIHGKFWDTYRAPGMGPSYFGAPISDPYFDSTFEMYRQDFEKGKSILESGEVITSSLTCPAADDGPMGPKCKCTGSKKESSCGKCGVQKWVCKNYTWNANGTCSNEGSCNLGEKEFQSCGKCGKGTKQRTCTASCSWDNWTSCNDPDSSKSCCDNMKNVCGGCAQITVQLNTPCGNNGTYICASPDSVTCKESPVEQDPPKKQDPPPPKSDPPPKQEDPPPPPSPKTNACGGTSTLNVTIGSPCGSCNAQWQCETQNTVKCTSGTTQYIHESKKVCGPKYCLQIVSISGSYATAKLSKIGGDAYGNMPLEWMVLNATNSKIMAIPNGIGCDKLYTGQKEITVSVNLKSVVGKASVIAEFFSGIKCGTYEATPPIIIEKCP